MTTFLEESGRLGLPWRLAIFVAGFVAVQLVLGLGVGTVGLTLLLVTQQRDLTEAAVLLQTPEVMIYLQIGAAVPMLLLLVLWVWLCRNFLDRGSMVSLGLARPESGWTSTALLATLAGGAPIALSGAVLVALSGLRFTGFSASLTTWLLIPTLLVMAFNEEIVFRGYCLGNFVEGGRRGTGVVTSSLLFWIVHGLNPQAWSSPLIPVNLFGAGVLLALAYLTSGNLWFPTVLHFVWNLTQGVILQIPVSGLKTDGWVDLEVTGRLPRWLTGGEFGLEASLLVTLGEVILVVWFLTLLRRRNQPMETAAVDSNKVLD